MQSLQQALNNSAVKPTRTKPELQGEAAVVSIAPKKLAAPRKSPSREGKENISAWLHPDFKKGLRLTQLRKEEKTYLDDLLAEALNDLFRKYDVPTVAHE